MNKLCNSSVSVWWIAAEIDKHFHTWGRKTLRFWQTLRFISEYKKCICSLRTTDRMLCSLSNNDIADDIGADFHRAMVATAQGEKLLIGRRPVRNWTSRTISSLFLCRKLHLFLGQEPQLSPRDRAMLRVSWNLANCHATVQKLIIRQVLTKSMVSSWRFSWRQCVINVCTQPRRDRVALIVSCVS